jgi:UDP-N-acetylmuramoylalanine--D-glutamate ligase
MDSLTGKRLLMLGLARQGLALAKFATAVSCTLTISDLRPAEQLQAEIDELAGLPIRYVLGEHPLSLLDEVDIIALSGSVPLTAPFIQEAQQRGIPLTNDSLEFVRRCPAPTIGITGSAGKSTTTTLLGEMGKASGRTTWVGGNLGWPLIHNLGEMQATDVVVQELSSFQLDLWTVSPQIAAVLNITPNHLDRHKTMENYSHAKANILRYQGKGDTAVLPADDPRAYALAPLVRGRLRLFSLHGVVADGAYVRDEQIWLADGDGGYTAVCPLQQIQLRGQHNLLNILAACTLADSAGLPISAMQTAIQTFRGVPHRLEIVSTINGVRYINDSIATAPERALAALAAFEGEPLILLAGGRDKNMVWETWAQTVAQQVQQIIIFGELAPQLATYLHQAGRTNNLHQTATLAEAVAISQELAQPGDIVLLSPGGTSFDAYADFAARGDEFRALVQVQAHQTEEQR